VKDSNQTLAAAVPLKAEQPPPSDPSRQKNLLALATAALCIAFGFPLSQLGRFALQHDLYSYVLLVPLVSGYLFITALKKVPTSTHSGNRRVAASSLALGLVSLAVFWSAKLSGIPLALQDGLALTTTAFVFLFGSVFAFYSSRSTFSHALFPLAFLFFMVPFPLAFEQGLEAFLQHGSAPPAYWLFSLAGTPVFKEGMVFQLPGISLQIAPECSGIRSTIVLFMTSILAGKLFLRSPWKRALLAGFVIPLALIRNGFRIFTIGELCVHVGPHMIDSDIHHKGGSIFFALSLIPFFLFVLFLSRSERLPKQSSQ
jgi:exosortase C (VPDSG-CTERM-specific)